MRISIRKMMPNVVNDQLLILLALKRGSILRNNSGKIFSSRVAENERCVYVSAGWQGLNGNIVRLKISLK